MTNVNSWGSLLGDGGLKKERGYYHSTHSWRDFLACLLTMLRGAFLVGNQIPRIVAPRCNIEARIGKR
jgi:hypothetical protein